MYSYLLDMSKGQKPNPMSDNELAEMRNLKKKVEYLKDQVEEHEDHGSEASAESEEEDHADEQPKKKNIKA